MKLIHDNLIFKININSYAVKLVSRSKEVL